MLLNITSSTCLFYDDDDDDEVDILIHFHVLISFYRAMHYSAKRGIEVACRLSVSPPVRLSVGLTLVNHDHTG